MNKKMSPTSISKMFLALPFEKTFHSNQIKVCLTLLLLVIPTAHQVLKLPLSTKSKNTSTLTSMTYCHLHPPPTAATSYWVFNLTTTITFFSNPTKRNQKSVTTPPGSAPGTRTAKPTFTTTPICISTSSATLKTLPQLPENTSLRVSTYTTKHSAILLQLNTHFPLNYALFRGAKPMMNSSMFTYVKPCYRPVITVPHSAIMLHPAHTKPTPDHPPDTTTPTAT